MIVRKLRLQRAWSQDQLAEFSGLSVRTIQRVERGRRASLETAKALAAVFEVEVSTFYIEETDMTDVKSLQEDEVNALAYAKRVKDFYEAVFIYVTLTLVFVVAIAFKNPALFKTPLLYLVFLAAGLGVLVQGLVAYELIRLPWANFEKRLVEKKLGRKL